ERAAGGVDDGSADAAVPDEQVRAAADDAHRDAALAAVADEKGEAVETVRLHPGLGRTTDEHGGVFFHWLVEAAVDLAFRHERAHFFEDFQIPGDAGAGFVDVSGTERDEQVSAFEGVADDVVGGGEIRHGGDADVTV